MARCGQGGSRPFPAVGNVASWVATEVSPNIASVLGVFAKRTVGLKGYHIEEWVDKMGRILALESEVPGFPHYLHCDLGQSLSSRLKCPILIMDPVL